VDWLPSLDLPGRVGLTFAPGKQSLSKYLGGSWARDLELDLGRLVDELEVEVLVCLLEEHELGRLRIPDLILRAEARGLEVWRLPIPDGGVLPDAGPVRALVGRIDRAVAAGRRVAIHCAGGLGRTGTVAGCWLRRRGLGPDEALETLQRVRSPDCPETDAQRDFIRRFEEGQG
jgi:protein-tyrosine phosphatase